MVAFLRVTASLALTMVVVVGLLVYLIAANFTQRLEQPGVYADAISDTGAYTRIYDEVLTDESLRAQTAGLLGNIDIPVHDDAVDVLRQVMPPAYLRQQTEDNIDRLTDFLSYDRDRLELYVVLEEPLESVESAALGKVHQYIDELEVEEPASSGCSAVSLQQLAESAAEPYSRLSRGQLPESVPSLEILSPECREREFDRWFDLLLSQRVLNDEVAATLDSRGDELRASFIEGDTREFLKAAADPVVEPLIEDAVSDARRNLPADDRFDLLVWLAGEPGTSSRNELDQNADTFRQTLGIVNGPVRIIVLVVVVLGALLLAALHIPRATAMLRWTGVALLTGGVVSLVVGIVVNSVLPGAVRAAVLGAVSISSDVPASAVDLAADLLESFARQATGGFLPGVVVVVLLGVLTLTAPLYSRRVRPLLERVRGGENAG